MNKKILIGSNIDEMICERCGSRKKIIKTWHETMLTFGGEKRTVSYKEMICTNEECQKEFEKTTRAERKRIKEAKAKIDEMTKNNKAAKKIEKKNSASKSSSSRKKTKK